MFLDGDKKAAIYKKVLNRLESKLLKALFDKDIHTVQYLYKIENNLLKSDKTAEWLLSDISILKLSKRIENNFRKKNINTIQDLIFIRPLRAEDYTVIKTIADAPVDNYCAISGKVISKSYRNHLSLQISDLTGDAVCNWFNVPFFLRKIIKAIKIGDDIVCEGKITQFNGYKTINHPTIKKYRDFKPRLNIVYPSYEKMRNTTIAGAIKKALRLSPKKPYDYLPYTVIAKEKLIFLSDVVHDIHTNPHTESVQERIKNEEAFCFMLALIMQQKSIEQDSAPKLLIGKNLTDVFTDRLQFSLTDAQQRAVEEIFNDMGKNRPMLRLLQGDVGSGKTAVAMFSAFAALKNGYQAAIMAPTQPLAAQIFAEAKEKFPEFNVKLITSSTKHKQTLYEQLKNGEIECIIGTHSLIQEDIHFKNLGLIVIDEQHRFGVNQRKFLSDKGLHPHTLIMSATPIPRTLAVMLYENSGLSILDEMPKGRKPVRTIHIKKQNSKIAFEMAQNEIAKHHQVYIVYPLIEESENQKETDAAIYMYEKLKKTYFKDCTIELLHGRMKGKEKEDIINRFKNRKIDCLISTTVIEVGIDSPYAALIIIENAEKFGLSTLHQLRGRVGRSSIESTAIFITKEDISKEAAQRIEALCRTNDGFKIAELDYELRGPGDIMGVRQHGGQNDLYMNILRDKKLMQNEKKNAERLMQAEYPLNNGLLKMLNVKWIKKFDYLHVG